MSVNSFDFYPLTWKPDISKLTRPVYQSLADLMEQDILSGVLPRDTKLPPQRELADYLDINFTTVTRTYRLCRQKGLIYGVKGSGTFVARFKQKSATVSPAVTGSMIELGFMEGFDSLNSKMVPVIKKVASRKNLERLFTYDYPLGMPHHLNMARQLFDYEPENIAITYGVQNSLSIAVNSVFSRGAKVVIDEFTYPNFIELAKNHNLKLITVPSDDEGMLATKLESICRQEHISGIYLMPTATNPTTQQISLKRRMELAHIIKEYGLILIEDDIMAFLADNKLPSVSSMVPENSINIFGTSKTICSGIGVAYMAYPEAMKESIETTIFNINVKTSSFNAEIMYRFFADNMFEELLAEKKVLAKQANEIFDRYFPQNKKKCAINPLCRWLEIKTDASGLDIEKSIAQVGVRVYHSDRFCISSTGKSYLRVSLSSASNADELEKGISVLRNYLAEKNYI